MANVSAQQVKSLRERTGAGMNDCRLALLEAEGIEDKALEIIQKKGLAKAAKKAGAIATEGVIHSYIHSNRRIGVLCEINCQTDFAARSDEFRAFAEEVALQIASSTPLYVRREEVAQTDKDKQMVLFKGQLEEEAVKTGKSRPEGALAKIMEGKLDKWLSEVCLEEQELVTRDDKKTVKNVGDELMSKTGEKMSVRRFARYELGEGLEKAAVKDFAAEVAATIKAS